MRLGMRLAGIELLYARQVYHNGTEHKVIWFGIDQNGKHL
jgi:hypothetical protein